MVNSFLSLQTNNSPPLSIVAWFSSSGEDAVTETDRFWRVHWLMITWKYRQDCPMGSRAAGRSVACIPQVDGEDWHLEQQGCRYLGVLGLAWVVWVLVRELGVNSKRLSLTKEHKHEAVLPN